MLRKSTTSAFVADLLKGDHAVCVVDAVGFDGYIRCLEERQRRELQILSRLPIKHMIIDNPQRDWNCAYEQIRQFILQL